jgi:hypothetical protein
MHCLLNVMHDCVGGSCIIDPAGACRRQEGATQNITVPALRHTGDANWILNSSMIRSGHLLKPLYGPVPLAPTADSISAKAARNLAKKTKVMDSSSSGNEDIDMEEQIQAKETAPKARRKGSDRGRGSAKGHGHCGVRNSESSRSSDLNSDLLNGSESDKETSGDNDNEGNRANTDMAEEEDMYM